MVFKLERRIPVRRVVGKLLHDRVHDHVTSKTPGLKRGDKAYPGLYQQAVTEVMGQLDADEKAEMAKTRDEWQETGPPLDIRLK